MIQNSKVKGMDIVRFVIVIGILILFMFPIYWMITTSFKPSLDILVAPPKWTFITNP